MSKLKSQTKDKKVTLANYRDQFVTVYGTDKNQYHETGKPIQLHPDSAKHLVAKGFATETEPEEEVPEEGGEE